MGKPDAPLVGPALGGNERSVFEAILTPFCRVKSLVFLRYGSKLTWKVVSDRPDPALTFQFRMVRGPCGPPPKV
jgi:hypothetical protein